MGAFYWITGILLGIAIGLGLALRIIVTLVMKSNDIGDSCGPSTDVGRGVTILEKKNGISSTKKLEKQLDSGRALLNIRRDTVGLPKK